jgi:hypothetical protein
LNKGVKVQNILLDSITFEFGDKEEISSACLARGKDQSAS